MKSPFGPEPYFLHYWIGVAACLLSQNRKMDFQHLPLPARFFRKPLPISHFYEFERLEAVALGAISPQGRVL